MRILKFSKNIKNIKNSKTKKGILLLLMTDNNNKNNLPKTYCWYSAIVGKREIPSFWIFAKDENEDEGIGIYITNQVKHIFIFDYILVYVYMCLPINDTIFEMFLCSYSDFSVHHLSYHQKGFVSQAICYYHPYKHTCSDRDHTLHHT